MLRQQTKPTNRVHGIITNGGNKPNIIPEMSEMEYCVRGLEDKDVIELLKKVIACAKGVANATGKALILGVCTCELTHVSRHQLLNISTSLA